MCFVVLLPLQRYKKNARLPNSSAIILEQIACFFLSLHEAFGAPFSRVPAAQAPIPGS
jgi:hypothetical protein